MRRMTIATGLFLMACGSSSPAPTQAVASSAPGEWALAAEAVAGVDDPALRDLFHRHWDWTMRESPVWATTRGDHRFDDQLGDVSAAATARTREDRRRFLEQARAAQSRDLGPRDQTTLALFIEDLESSIDSEVCDFQLWSISARGNVLTQINRLPEDHPVSDRASADALLSRYEAVEKLVDDSAANLRAGIERKLVSNAESLRLTALMLEGELKKPVESWAIVSQLQASLARSELSDAEKLEIGARALGITKERIVPAIERYLAVVRDEALPAGREGDQIGLVGLPIGEACYRARIRNFLALDMTPAEIHEFGMREIERINQEMTTLGQKLFGTSELATTIEHLRTDPSLYYQDGPSIVTKAQESLARAKAAIPEHFGILPRANCRVVEIPDYEAPYTTIAYYREPQSGGRPGEYFINTFEPTTRPRFEMEVLAYHESIPGHHLQIAIAQELGDLPAFRRFGGTTAFVEGWALYTERLADEMGLYTGDLDRMGMLSYDAWRASRLVVDTGIHAMGWTREQAEAFMLEHTALTPGNIKNEVDRYISWPGQALAYKIGQKEILRLREEARSALGGAFDLRGFHDAVLGQGAVTLPVLDAQVKAWVASVQTP